MADEDRRHIPEMRQRKYGLDVVVAMDNIRPEWNAFQPVHDRHAGSHDLVGDNSETRGEDADLMPGLGQSQRQVPRHDLRAGTGSQRYVG